mmetsp:Transcript_15040/g.43434  ORF Transcript_15040/g.43434 Transcript_15040/m.43434 type:complete len:324 (+) Transcript_15040:1780-2751(+)
MGTEALHEVHLQVDLLQDGRLRRVRSAPLLARRHPLARPSDGPFAEKLMHRQPVGTVDIHGRVGNLEVDRPHGVGGIDPPFVKGCDEISKVNLAILVFVEGLERLLQAREVAPQELPEPLDHKQVRGVRPRRLRRCRGLSVSDALPPREDPVRDLVRLGVQQLSVIQSPNLVLLQNEEETSEVKRPLLIRGRNGACLEARGHLVDARGAIAAGIHGLTSGGSTTPMGRQVEPHPLHERGLTLSDGSFLRLVGHLGVLCRRRPRGPALLRRLWARGSCRGLRRRCSAARTGAGAARRRQGGGRRTRTDERDGESPSPLRRHAAT